MALYTPPREVFTAMHALFSALGKPHRDLMARDAGTVDVGSDGSQAEELMGLHPAFSLSESFGPGDAGYTANPFSRGCHFSLPSWDEKDSGAVVLETSFYKGSTYLERLTFPDTQHEVSVALITLLQEFEIRD